MEERDSIFDLINEIIQQYAVDHNYELVFDVCEEDDEDVSPSLEDESVPFEPDPCPGFCEECEAKCSDYFEFGHWEIPFVSRIIFNPPATIVFWMDGTKTVVKCSKRDRFDKYLGFAAAVMKKMFGSSNRADKFIERMTVPSKGEKE